MKLKNPLIFNHLKWNSSKAEERRKAEAKAEEKRRRAEAEAKAEEKRRRAEKERRRAEEAARQKVKSEPIVKTEPVTDPFGSSDDDSSDDQSQPTHLNVKSEPRNDDHPPTQSIDPFDDSDSDSDQDQPNIKNEPYDPVQSNNQFKLPSSGTTTLNQNGKKKDPKDKVPLVKLAEKSKERRKKEKKKTKTNQIVSLLRVNSENFHN